VGGGAGVPRSVVGLDAAFGDATGKELVEFLAAVLGHRWLFMGGEDLVGQLLGALVGLEAARVVPVLEVGPRRDHRLEVLGGVALPGVGGAEEVAGRTDLGDGLDGERGVVDHERLEHLGDAVEEVGVDDHLLVGGEEAALEPAGAVQQEVDAAHDGAPDGDDALVGGLGIDAVGGVDVRGTEGEPVATGQLAADEAGLPVLGGAEGGAAGAHVDVRGEAAVADGRAGSDHLGVGDPGEGLGVLENEGAGDGHGGHGAGQRERRDDDQLVAGRHLLDAVEHHGVVAQRCAGVDHRVDRGLVADGDLVDAAGDAGHLDGVQVARPTEAVDERDLVRERQHVVGGLEVPDGRVQVHGFDGVSRHRVDGVEDLPHLDEVPVVVPVAVAPVASQAGDEGRAGNRRVDDVVAAEHEVSVGVAAVQGELVWRRRDQAFDEVGVKPDPLAVDVGAGVGQLAAGGVVEEVDAGLGEDPQRRLVDGLELVVGHGTDGVEQHPGLLPRWLFGDDVADFGPAAALPAARTHRVSPGFGRCIPGWYPSCTETSAACRRTSWAMSSARSSGGKR